MKVWMTKDEFYPFYLLDLSFQPNWDLVDIEPEEFEEYQAAVRAFEAVHGKIKAAIDRKEGKTG